MEGNKKKMSLKAAVHFAAPQTWPAAVMPSILGACAAAGTGTVIHPFILLGILITSVLLQSAVNTFNDYRDFVTGLDSAENCDDPDDAAMIYDCSSPKAALILGLVFMCIAGVTGITVVVFTSAYLIIFALYGLAAIVLYTMPKFSFSRLPIGELLSGSAMGGAITLASYFAQTGRIDLPGVLCCIPAIATIGGILTVNNTCDIEKDIPGGRRTFSICVGRKTAQTFLRIELLAVMILCIVITAVFFPAGIAAMIVMALGQLFNYSVHDLFKNDLTAENRREAMGGILASHKWITGSLSAAAIIQSVVMSQMV